MNEGPPEGTRLQVFRLGEEPPVDPFILSLTEGERIELAWQLTRQCWIVMGEEPDAPFRRDVGRLVRGVR